MAWRRSRSARAVVAAAIAIGLVCADSSVLSAQSQEEKQDQPEAPPASSTHRERSEPREPYTRCT
jgi:hypothetical protein